MKKSPKSQYEQIEQGVWIDWGPVMHLACCSCGFTHEIRYRLKNHKLQLKFRIDGPATGGLRRHHQHECVRASAKKRAK